MPRLPRNLIRQAWHEDRLLLWLLRAVRDLNSARLELKWIREHIQKNLSKDSKVTVSSAQARTWLDNVVRSRSRGFPLQYLLGTEYFGSLQLLCKPGVLIPRSETAASVQYLLQRIPRLAPHLPRNPGILDLCTGTGCIPLLISVDYPYGQTLTDCLRVLGVDISAKALSLARQNQVKVQHEFCQEPDQRNLGRVARSMRMTLKDLKILQADVLTDNPSHKPGQSLGVMSLLHDVKAPTWDIVTSNPPYISPMSFARDTTRSVRNYEPRLALVPPPRPDLNATKQGDMFYPRIEQIARQVQAKILLMEVADMEQAHRVVEIVRQNEYWRHIEIWRDNPGACSGESDDSGTDPTETKIHGVGHGRSVFCCSFEL